MRAQNVLGALAITSAQAGSESGGESKSAHAVSHRGSLNETFYEGKPPRQRV